MAQCLRSPRQGGGGQQVLHARAHPAGERAARQSRSSGRSVHRSSTSGPASASTASQCAARKAQLAGCRGTSSAGTRQRLTVISPSTNAPESRLGRRVATSRPRWATKTTSRSSRAASSARGPLRRGGSVYRSDGRGAPHRGRRSHETLVNTSALVLGHRVPSGKTTTASLALTPSINDVTAATCARSPSPG